MTLTTSATTLEDALAEATARYVDRNPVSAARAEAARAVLPGGNTRSVLHFDPFPIAFVRGEGATLTSADGEQYTDLLGEFTAGLYGHSEPRVIGAMRRALDDGLSFGGVNLLEARLAELVTARFPAMDLVRFTNSGTEANLMALALAVHTTGRRRIVVFRGGYHGGVLSFGATPSPVTVPHDFMLADYNDIEGTRALLASTDVAAVLVEPMLGSGGCIPASSAFLRMLREETTAQGALIVFDEVMTSRLGPGGLQVLEGIAPDLTTLGKYLGGGSSFGAFGGRADLMAAFDPGAEGALAHAGTFNNNVLSMAAGIAGLTEVLTDDALEALNARGDRLREALNAVAQQRGAAFFTSGRGSMLVIHPGATPLDPAAPLTSAQAAARRLLFLDLLESGFWVASRGFLALSLPVTDDDCDRFVAAFDRFLADRAGLFEGLR